MKEVKKKKRKVIDLISVRRFRLMSLRWLSVRCIFCDEMKSNQNKSAKAKEQRSTGRWSLDSIRSHVKSQKNSER